MWIVLGGKDEELGDVFVFAFDVAFAFAFAEVFLDDIEEFDVDYFMED